ncbi:4-(cytidine 5'-diphospho)-2-C-methyl-D-erythritol kinase [Candidatus Erwinia haradaeae]|uniref:4-diphosphocytidyl-2-C-methyl-D-erythritol kinase n=1 Tax=Candidatus Erwinia haradaeae TaxID=1922217 RepID=A0A451D2I0_9GAMM|nr:4-(cytidine 5'-diphospho)-2-C-methyl-D-erythritol kinase [Candidatus Erwinia haradaeae]VFP79868.1 4-diphosphocytidyl-2-C-methyl-D-erythritol kinase [Candidatus Erwinia haradaeae]
MITKWPAPAKINLFLYITGRRNDGYHNLQTLFQLLDYGDTLFIENNLRGDLQLLTSLPGITEEHNLIIRAAKILRDHTKLYGILPDHSGVTFQIEKKLPIGGGLGGGSSNAATVLVALNYLWGSQFSKKNLATLGLKLGADVPLFVYGLSSFAEGIGELLTPISLSEKWYLVVYPGVKISTYQIFNDPLLTRNTPRRHMNDLLLRAYFNDCQFVARNRFYEVEKLIFWLRSYGLPILTGTGSCVCLEFYTEFFARQVLKKIPAGLQGFVAKGVNISPLYYALRKHIL